MLLMEIFVEMIGKGVYMKGVERGAMGLVRNKSQKWYKYSGALYNELSYNC